MTASIAAQRPREFAPGIWWFPGCIPTGPVFDGVNAHIHASQYLIVGAESTLLVDAGLPALWRELSDGLDEILGDRPLDWVVPTHPEVPHAGDLHRLMQKYPDLKVGGDVRDYHLYYPDIVDRLHPTCHVDTIELGGGYRFTVLPAVIRDLPNTVWGYEASQQVLFTADAISYTHHVPAPDLVGDEEGDDVIFHLPGECSQTSGELGVAPNLDQASFITKAALYWTRYVPMEPFFAELDQLMDGYPVRMMAPAHGNVVTNLDEIMPVIKEAHRIAYQQGGNVRDANPFTESRQGPPADENGNALSE